MTNGFGNFIKGNTKNHMNVSGLMFLIILILPSFILDMVFIAMWNTGQPWIDFTTSIGLTPNFIAWGFACFILNGFNIFLLCRAIKNNRDSRIAENDDPLNR